MKPQVRLTTKDDVLAAEERRKKAAAAARLPDMAEAKLRALAQAADEAQALVANCKDRLGKLQADANKGHGADAKEIGELQAAMARHDARYRNNLAVLRTCRDFLGVCERDGVRLEPYVRKGGGRVRLRTPDTPPQKMIEQLRLTIDTLRTTIAGIDRLPAPFEDQRAVVEKFVDELLQLGRPTLIMPNGELRLAFPAGAALESNFNGFSNRRLLALAMFLSGADRDTVVTKLCELLPPTSKVNAMSKAEKEAKAADLRDQILQAERDECALIGRLAEDGVYVAYRNNTDPLAILGLAVAQRARAAA
jgi:hypothetical protein